MEMHVAESPLAPSLLWPDVPPGLEKLLVRMLDKDPERRPHIVEVRLDLQALRRATPAPSAPPVDELHAPVREVIHEATAKVRGARRHVKRVAVPVLVAVAAGSLAWALLGRDDARPRPVVAAPVVAAPLPAPPPVPLPPPAVPVEPAPAAVSAPPPAPEPARRPAPRPRRLAKPRVDGKTLVDPFAPAAHGH
jgi:hypothetical protein